MGNPDSQKMGSESHSAQNHGAHSPSSSLKFFLFVVLERSEEALEYPVTLFHAFGFPAIMSHVTSIFFLLKKLNFK